MSEENKKHQVTKFCVYCGTTIQKNTTYCPNPKCGKLVVNIKPSKAIIDQAKPNPNQLKKNQYRANVRTAVLL